MSYMLQDFGIQKNDTLTLVVLSQNRPTLRIGARSEAVREMQTLLLSWGFSPGPIDGIFGPLTQNAVMAFQRDRGLVVDGIVGPITWNALLSGNTVTPPPTNRPMLRIGARGEVVRELQLLLASFGFSPGPIDGIFGPLTQNAVMAFQRDRGLVVDGDDVIIGLYLLCMSNA